MSDGRGQLNMAHVFHLRSRVSLIAIPAVIGVIAGFVLWGGGAGEFQPVLERRPAGHPQLISVEPLPAMDGEMCEWVPASTQTRMVAALRQEQQALLSQGVGGLVTRSAAASTAEPGTDIELDRAPLRVIRDPYPTFSAVAVDPIRNEIVLQDENLFSIMVYNRLADTPPTATMTEPKRVIGGHDTKIEFNCGLYIDPASGDIYSINNDTVDTMVVFSRQARGNVAPDRELSTPHRTWGITVDEQNQELFLTVQHPPAVVIYPKMAEGNDAPIRMLEGDRTGLEDPHGIALDTKNNWMFVSNHGSVSNNKGGKHFLLRPIVDSSWAIPTAAERRRSVVPGSGRYEPPSITVYPLQASGDTQPLRIIEGPKTQLNWPAGMSLDVEHGELFVANDVGDSILVFRVTDSGNVAPIRVLQGPQTGIKNPTGVFWDAENQELVVSNMGNHSATVYPRTAQGDTAPLRTIRAAPQGKQALAIGNPGAVGYDTKRDEILVPN